MLSPSTAETGTATASRKPNRSASARNSASMSRNRASDQSGQVHLVDGQDHPLNAHQVEDGRMAPRLHLDAGAGVDQQDGDIGMRRAGRHVARVLLVAGAVDDDEAAGRRVEVAPGDIDGDALLALGGEAIDQQAEIGRARRSLGRPLQHLPLVGVQGSGVPQQAADQRRFAVVDRPAGEDMQAAGQVLLRSPRAQREQPSARRSTGAGAFLDAADLGERRHQK